MKPFDLYKKTIKKLTKMDDVVFTNAIFHKYKLKKTNSTFKEFQELCEFLEKENVLYFVGNINEFKTIKCFYFDISSNKFDKENFEKKYSAFLKNKSARF